MRRGDSRDMRMGSLVRCRMRGGNADIRTDGRVAFDAALRSEVSSIVFRGIFAQVWKTPRAKTSTACLNGAALGENDKCGYDVHVQGSRAFSDAFESPLSRATACVSVSRIRIGWPSGWKWFGCKAGNSGGRLAVMQHTRQIHG